MAKTESFDVRTDICTCQQNGQRIRLSLHEPVDVANAQRAEAALRERIAHLWDRSSSLPAFVGLPAQVTIVLEEPACLPTGELLRLLDRLHEAVGKERPDVPFQVTVASSDLVSRAGSLHRKPYFILPSAN